MYRVHESPLKLTVHVPWHDAIDVPGPTFDVYLIILQIRASYNDCVCKSPFELNENSSNAGPAIILLSSTLSALVVIRRKTTPRKLLGILMLLPPSERGKMKASCPLMNAPYNGVERSRLLGGVNWSDVIEPGLALAGSGSVSWAYEVMGRLGFVGGHEVMKLDAIVKA